jgi:hypothetical protein
MGLEDIKIKKAASAGKKSNHSGKSQALSKSLIIYNNNRAVKHGKTRYGGPSSGAMPTGLDLLSGAT